MRRTGIVYAAIAMMLSSPATAAKKPKPENPSACLAAVCIQDLRWNEEINYPDRRTVTQSILGTFTNGSSNSLSGISLNFVLVNERDAVISSARAVLGTTLPPGGKWEFNAFAGAFGLIGHSPFVVTSAADFQCSGYDSKGKFTIVKDTFNFNPVFGWGVPGRDKKRWLQTH